MARSSEHIQDVLSRYMPHPKRFHQAWNKQTGDKELYCWKPVPPSKRFVSLGIVCTNSPEDPPVECIRCVPASWVKPVTEEVTPVWNDAGSGGRPGAVWTTNAEGMMAAAQRHTPPHEIFYTLKTDEFFINPLDDQSAADVSNTFMQPSPYLDLIVLLGRCESEMDLDLQIERDQKKKFAAVVIDNPGFAFVSDFAPVWNSAKAGTDAEASVWR